MQKTIVELEDINGYWWTLAGPQAGDRGVYLGVGVSGLMDAPVKVVYETPGNWPGSRYLNHRVLQRDLVFAVEIMDACGESWLQRDSAWRKAWSYTQDCKLYVTTDDGRRYLKLRLPDYDYEQHFGGATYLFLKGMEPSLGADHGAFRDRPSLTMIEALEAALEGA